MQSTNKNAHCWTRFWMNSIQKPTCFLKTHLRVLSSSLPHLPSVHLPQNIPTIILCEFPSTIPANHRLMGVRTWCVDHSGSAVEGMNRFRLLEHWGHWWESHLSHGCLCAFILFVLFLVSITALRRAHPPSKVSSRLRIGLRNSKKGPMSKWL
jgi:hypothetical protein